MQYRFNNKFDIANTKEIKIKSNSRVLVVGRSGSGKTTFTTQFLWNRYRGVNKIFIDPKRELIYLLNDFDIICHNSKNLETYNINKNRVLYMPEDVSNIDFESVCEYCFEKGNTTLFIDESAYYCTSSRIPKAYKKLMIMGRSRGVGVVNTTQRPNGINQLLLSEAEHFFIFSLNLKSDKEKLKTMIPHQYHHFIDKMPLHHFFYANLRENQFIYFNPIKINKYREV